MDKEWIIYCHTNKVNGKKYIGQTCQSTRKRWQYGAGYRKGTYIRKAIDKYGWDNFAHEILERGLTIDEANEREKYYIEKYQTHKIEYGYNLTLGGNNGVQNDEIRAILSEKAKARKGANTSMFGKHFSEEHKRKIRESNLKSAVRNPIVCAETGTVYQNAHSAGRETGINYTSILRCCKGIYRQTHGLHFEYAKAVNE